MTSQTSDDDHADDTPEDIRETLDLEIRTVGARAAYEALLSVCLDRAAPAPARATAGTSILRAAGMLNRPDGDGSKKQPHEMSADELAREINSFRKKARRLEANRTTEDESGNDGGVFN